MMDQMEMSAADRENYGKRFKNWQFCHVEISDGTRQYKVLLTIYQVKNEQTKEMDYYAMPVAGLHENTDQENKDAPVLFSN